MYYAKNHVFTHFRNAWPPLQEILVTALENTGDPEGQALALDLVKKWVKNNYMTYMSDDKKAMYEKYDCRGGYPGNISLKLMLLKRLT